MQQYFGVVSVASPMKNDISSDTKRITWDNDPVGRWIAHMGTPTPEEVHNPIRRVEWEYEPCLMTDENCLQPIPDPYAKESDLGKIANGKYTAIEYYGTALLGVLELGNIDPASNVHAFTYYMGEPLAEDIVLKKGPFGGALKMGRRNFSNPFKQNETLQTDIAKVKILEAIKEQLDKLEQQCSTDTGGGTDNGNGGGTDTGGGNSGTFDYKTQCKGLKLPDNLSMIEDQINELIADASGKSTEEICQDIQDLIERLSGSPI